MWRAVWGVLLSKVSYTEHPIWRKTWPELRGIACCRPPPNLIRNTLSLCACAASSRRPVRHTVNNKLREVDDWRKGWSEFFWQLGFENGEKVAKMASGCAHGACAQCSPKSRFLRILSSPYFKVPISHFFLFSETRSRDMFFNFTNVTVNENS